MKGSLLLFVTATVFLATLYFCVTTFKLEAIYAESNYFRDMQRLEGFFRADRKDVILVGSSIAARLHPDEFEDGKLGFVNLGLDGTVINASLTILEKEKVKPKWLLVEFSVLTFAAPRTNDNLILSQQNDLNRYLWRFFPLARPSFRPSSILYSYLKKKKENDAAAEQLKKLHLSRSECNDALEMPKIRPGLIVGDSNPALMKLVKFKDEGVRILFVKIPSGDQYEAPPEFYDMAAMLKAPILDLSRLTKHKKVEMNYTDGLHLDRASAKICSMWLAEVLGSCRF